jgi:hypothetical protein
MVFRRSASASHGQVIGKEVPVWVDALGRSVLSQRPSGQGSYFRLHTRFHPSWSELAESPELPARLLTILLPEPASRRGEPLSASVAAPHPLDQRAIDPSQVLLFEKSKATSASVISKTYRTTELRPWLVLVAALLFAWERLLAWRRSNTVLPSNP